MAGINLPNFSVFWRLAHQEYSNTQKVLGSSWLGGLRASLLFEAVSISLSVSSLEFFRLSFRGWIYGSGCIFVRMDTYLLTAYPALVGGLRG